MQLKNKDGEYISKKFLFIILLISFPPLAIMVLLLKDKKIDKDE